jgi:hypothetical protein
MASKFITIPDGTGRWGPGRSTLYHLIGGGHLAAVRCGRRTLLDVEVGDRYFASLPRIAPHAEDITEADEGAP